MKTSFKEEWYKFRQKKTPLYGIILLMILMLYTAMTGTVTQDMLIMGFGFGQWLFIILLTIASDFVAMEYREQTIVTLFYKHSKKVTVYLAKFIVVTLYGCCLLVVGLILTFIMKGILVGDRYSWLSLYQSNHSLLTSLALNTIGSLFYSFFTVALSFFLLSLTRVNGLVIGIGLFIGFFGASFSTAIMRHFPKIISFFKWNPFNMIYIVNQLPNPTYIQFSYLGNKQIIIGTILYTLFFLGIGFVLFKKRNV